MNVQAAAINTKKLLDVDLERDEYGQSLGHACWMLNGIAMGYIQHEKAHRWLGYAQALLVVDGNWTLDQMKTINKES